MTTQLMIDAASLIPFNDAVNHAEAEVHRCCTKYERHTKPVPMEVVIEFNEAMRVLNNKLHDAYLILHCHVDLLLTKAVSR